jgi:integrase
MSKPRPKLSDLWEAHSRERLILGKWVPDTAQKNRENYDKAVRILGDRELGEYTDQDALHVIEVLAKKGQSISSQKFCVELLSTLWKNALKKPKMWHVDCNPFLEKSPKDPRPEHEEQDPFDKKDIERMFVYLSKKQRQVEPEKFWSPLIALYSGMRLNEVSQLRVADIEDADGILIFNIHHKPEEYNQTTKNKKSRICPVHPALLSAGFRNYWKERQAAKADRLLKNVYLYRGKWGKKIGNWFNRGPRPKVAPDGDKSFNSLRHSFMDYCKQNGLYRQRHDELVVESMVGHDPRLLAATSLALKRYGKAYVAKQQLKLLKKINYGVDLKLLEKDK